VEIAFYLVHASGSVSVHRIIEDVEQFLGAPDSLFLINKLFPA